MIITVKIKLSKISINEKNEFIIYELNIAIIALRCPTKSQ